MASKLMVQKDEADKFHCPVCEFISPNLQTVRKHAIRTHSQHVTVKKEITDDERRARQRGYEREHREKKRAPSSNALAGSTFETERAQRSIWMGADLPRPVFTMRDAATRGVDGAENPIVFYDQSLIDGGGIGLFAAEVLQPDDIVTRFSGRVVDEVPSDPAYAIELPSRGRSKRKYLDCIRMPVKGLGLGSFVNREERAQRYARKNCVIITVGRHSYIQIIKRVPKHGELYSTYGRDYRIKK